MTSLSPPIGVGAPPPHARDIIEILRLRARSHPHAPAFTFLQNAPLEPETISYRELDRRARCIADQLTTRGLARTPVLLLHPAGLPFVEAFFGALYARVIAVPAYPPRANRTLGRIDGIAADSGARVALTTEAQLARAVEAAATAPHLADLEWIASDALTRSRSDAAPDDGEAELNTPTTATAPDPDRTAYLQYTSGSTANPKGVMVSHRNILANAETIRVGFRHDAGSRSLSWLPHFHDMGLIDGILLPIYAGFPAFLMDPLSFLQNPARWLEVIGEQAITHSGGPNFAYDLCARRITGDLARFDLSSWSVAYNGAEPVRAETLDRFAERFAAAGFRRRAFYPAYGLAEATLKVTGGDRGAGPSVLALDRTALARGEVAIGAEDLLLVGAGRAVAPTEVRIVDPERAAPLGENQVGEIWVGGPSVAGGYWNRPEESRSTFAAILVGEEAGIGGYLRTGDLGFVRGGELFVTGRRKDLIIVRGRNLYPQDIEQTAEACGGAIRPAASAAFSVERDEERLVVVLELERHGSKDHELLFRAVREAILETHEVDPLAIVLVRPASVPKTSSGKVQRAACRQAFLEGTLATVAEWRAPLAASEAEIPGNEVEPLGSRGWLAARIARKLGLDAGQLPSDRSLLALGLDSLRATELAHEISDALGLDLRAVELIEARDLVAVHEAVEAALQARAAAGPIPAGPRPTGEECDLTAGQRALWFMQELAPESSAYTISSALRLDGAVDETALHRSVLAVVARHPALRTRIVGGARPRQRFDVEAEALYAVEDWAVEDWAVEDWPIEGPAREAGPGAALAVRLADAAAIGFDFARGPLVRIRLIRVGEMRILFIAAHHVVADLWSLSIVLRDLVDAYRRIVEPPLLQGEFASRRRGSDATPHPAWLVEREQQYLAGEAGARGLDYWRSLLLPEAEPITLPSERMRPQQQQFLGALRRHTIPAPLATRLRAAARSGEVTLFTYLLSGFQALVARLSGQSTVAVGAPSAARGDAGLAELVGYLVNPIVLRADLADDPTFAALVARNSIQVQCALRHDRYPFAELVRRLGPERRPGRSPFFDLMFELRGVGDLVRGDLAAGGGAPLSITPSLSAVPIELERRSAQFDLSVSVTDDPRGLEVEFEYDRALFAPARIDAFARAYVALLEATLESPHLAISRLPLLRGQERRLALGPVPSDVPFDPEAVLDRQVANQARRRPEAIAARDGERRLSYALLDAAVDRLAHRLRALGVGPEVRVLIPIEKSLELVVAILATLRAGGAYLPVDPGLPTARLRLIAADSDARLSIVRGGAAPELDLPTVEVSDPLSEAERERTEPVVIAVPADALAYVIYTSGTTGRPKGVGVSRRNLAGAYRAWDLAYDLGRLPVHLAMAAPSFDVFTGDLVRALGAGQELVLCDRETLLDPPALATLCARHQVAFGDFLPATLRELAHHLVQADLRLDAFRLLVVGSDAWHMSDYRLFRRAFPHPTPILNSYGVTEATVDSCFDVIPESDLDRASPTIGRPLANTASYVLDRALEPTPPGVAGTLYLAGPALARGYLGHPDWTAERFRPDPFGLPGARMYDTGDAARRLEDGRIEFLGRGDTQVKIRGHRIETAEIEAVLETHPEVRRAIVTAPQIGATQRLVAYILGPVNETALREHTRALLPEYMLPAAFLFLESLPLTPHGKVDRKALPEPRFEGGKCDAGRPLDRTETALAAIWQRLLGVASVGAEDDFFALGGDSILGIQLVGLARAAGLALTPRLLFEHPTLEALARVASAIEPPHDAQAWAGDAPLLPIQQWFFAQDFIEPHHWNLAFALDTTGRIEPRTIERAAEALLDRHDALRARFPSEGGRTRQVISEVGKVAPALRVIDAEGESHTRVVRRIAEEDQARLDLERGPLIRFSLVRSGVTHSTLLVTAHHLVVDGVSLRLLAEDLARAQAMAERGEAIDLGPRAAAPFAYARALEAHYRNRPENAATATIDDAVPDAPLWSSAPEAPVPLEASTRHQVVRWSTEETATLAPGRRDGRRLEAMLLAAVLTAIAATTKRPRLRFERETHGRDLRPEIDLSRTVGWFTEVDAITVDQLDPGGLPRTVARVARLLRGRSGDRLARRAYGGVRSAAPEAEISWNFLGRFAAEGFAGTRWGAIREPEAARRSPRARRTHPLEIDAGVIDGRLSISLAHAPEQIPPEVIEEIAARTRVGVELLLLAESDATGSDAAEGDAVGTGEVQRDAHEGLPLSPMQAGMFYHHARAEGDDPYLAQITLRLDGRVDLDALAAAWRQLFARQPALRATFAADDDGTPRQWTAETVELPVTRHRLDTAIGERTEESELERITAATRAAGFDLAHAPLARIDLLSLPVERTWMIFTHHHLLLDGWSLPLLIEELFLQYTRLRGDAPGDDPERGDDARSRPRGDAAEETPPEETPPAETWRRYLEWIESSDHMAAERYFRESLGGLSEPSPAPAPWGLAGRPDGQPGNGTGVVTACAPRDLESRARSFGLTPNTLVQAAWALCLAQSLGRDDVVFGATTAGRPPTIPGIEGAIGLFINTLPQRVRLAPESRVLLWLRALQRAGAELRSYEYTSLAAAQRLAGTPVGVPLFETLLVFENYPLDAARLRVQRDFVVGALRLHEETNYPLTLVTAAEEGLGFRLLYDRARYDETGAVQLRDRFLRALESLLSHPEARLGDLPSVSEAELSWLLDAGRGAETSQAPESLVTHFERRAALDPEAIAIRAGSESLSYAALDADARRFARGLLSLGVRAEEPVLLALPRSIDLIVAILGTLRAGAAYVPVDPEAPPARVERMAADLAARHRIENGGEPGTWSVASVLARGVEPRPLPSPAPDQLAYVMFTSGSTGAPKGIEITHANVRSLAFGTEHHRTGRGDVLPLLAPIAFDASTLEIWTTLLHGGTLAIAPTATQSAAELARFLRESGATSTFLTTGLFQVMVDEEPETLARLRQVSTGGDVLSPAHLHRFFARGGRRLVNCYGPTEATTFVAADRLDRDELGLDRAPIGRPIAGARLYLLDRALRPVAPGSPGEICIGGPSLGRGYARRPDLTAERFVPDPYGPAGSRIYRTGDLARWRDDGRLEFLGRRDGQIKLRGFRVEIGEIEAALLALPSVREAAVAIHGERGAARLTAYIVGISPAERDPSQLRAALERTLPRWMIPATVLFLDALPRTTNGKLDRRALPTPDAPDSSGRGGAYASPLEARIGGLFAAILEVPSVGPDDDFFELGGHSLHATRVIARLGRELNLDLPLRALFEAPTPRALAGRITEGQGVTDGQGITGERRTSVAPSATDESPDVADRVDGTADRSLASFGQARLWFLDRLEPGSAAYTVASAIRIEGPLDFEALEQAISASIARHEALRTRFADSPQGLRQIIDPPYVPRIALDRLDRVPEDARWAEAERRATHQVRRPFDLETGPLLRLALYRIGAEGHLLAVAMHHIVSDGWSIGILMRELAAQYRTGQAGQASPLPPLAWQYADWAAWQRRRLEAGRQEHELAYWRSQLEGIPALALPTDHPRPARPTSAGRSFAVTLDRAVVDRLRAVARAEGATLHMALVTGFAAVLSRWSGQEDFGIGTPVANRTRPEAEELIGVFINSLVLRARLKGERLTYRALLRRMRETALSAYAHQEAPFDAVVTALQPERDLSRTPLFQVMFVLQNAPSAALSLGAARVTPVSLETGTSTFDLTLSLEETEAAGLRGELEYSTELFDEVTPRRLWSHLTALLQQAATDPDLELRQAPLESAAERRRALEHWSGAGQQIEIDAAAAESPLVHLRMLAQAEVHPERIAAILGARSLRYDALRDRGLRLAAHLATLGVGPEDRVGLLLPRSPELVIAMVATLSAGAAFVPLDPDHPRDRVRFALTDAGVKVLLTTAEGLGTAAEDGQVIVRIDDPRCFDHQPLTPRAVSGLSAAYVIYTSGTTGRPKGVIIPHRAIGAALRAWEQLYGLTEIRRHLQMASVGFDVCTGDVVRALGSGGTLVFCPREALLDPAALFDLADAEQVEFAEFVPAVLRPLAAFARRAGRRLTSLRIVAVGSDVWSTAEIAEFRAAFGSATRLANSYGVTEATVDSTCWFVDERRLLAGSPPIGSPLAHGTVYVLDPSFAPTPPGVIGELYLGGAAVGRGYLGRPELTAERFVPDPFGRPGERLYRTGDRARYLESGEIVFAGRGDDQVKIRGQRVELTEIEAALTAHPDVAAAVVVVRTNGELTRLAAYLVARHGSALDLEAVRRRARETLPEAWVPAAFVPIGALPLTPNGKVDRRRLPEPIWSAAEDRVEPQTRTEAAVVRAFAEVLQLESVSALDDFFALGGHSLLAVRVITRLREALGVEPPLRLLFEAPAVRDLARALDDLPGGEARSGAVPPAVRRADPEVRRGLSFAQRRLWFLDRLEPGSPAYNLPTVIRIRGRLEHRPLERAIAALVQRHEALRTGFVERSQGPEQEVREQVRIEPRWVDLTAWPEEERHSEQRRRTEEEARLPFDLAAGPLLRVVVFALSESEHALLVTIHHIAADGWSLVVLMRELGLLYAACARGDANPLPDLEIQYADWAAWQRAWLAQGEMERQLAVWRAELEGSETLVLPADRARPARPTYAGAQVEVRIGRELRRRLEGLARAEGATLHMVLLAGFGAALSRWSGQENFAIGTPVANRRTREAEPLIGFFVNTLALRMRLGGRELSFRGAVRRVREAALVAQNNQDVPFERVVEELLPERSLGHTPLFQVLFALQNVPVGAIEMPGLSLSYEEPDTGVTRFDLELFLAETESYAAARLDTDLSNAGELEGLLNYSAERFDRATARRFVDTLIALLEAATEDPDRPLRRLPAMAAPDLESALRTWNATEVSYGDPERVHLLFEQQAHRTPERIAVRHRESGGAERTLTYSELNRRANQLAHYLRNLGVGAEHRVAIAARRSPELLVALVGVMKSGAAYVPVDPEYPRERIALILADSGADLVLTEERLATRLFAPDAALIRLDADWPRIELSPSANPEASVDPDGLVYLVYTSGSTGRPKGVAMTHRAISNLLSWQRRDSGSEAPPRTLQFASLSFDVSFQEIFSALTAGGEVVLIDEEARRDSVELLRIVERTKVERLFLPFVALHQLAEAAAAESIYPGSLREINAAGEQLRITPALRGFFRRLPHCRLVNHYGPSETHLVTVFELSGPPEEWAELPSIGRAIPNAPVYLLDPNGEPVPIGATGELYVGGVGLARGYHDRPDLTAERFVPDPFARTSGARLYRTGDLARYRNDGNLEFLGRSDLQVKIRGHRVEPGEIESALARHPAVREAAVRAHEHEGGRRLAGYVVLQPDRAVSEGDLRAFLAVDLPDYMVPAAIVFLPSLPLSPNGKVDRTALAEPDWGGSARRVAPRTPEEEMVAGIIAEVLGSAAIGVTDDFFELGGHSLLATSVISRVRRAFAVEVPLRALFENPTARGIAAAAVLARGSAAATPPPLRRTEGPERRRLSFAQQRLWFLQRLDPESPAYHLPTAVRLRGDLDRSALEWGLSEIVRRHEALRTRFIEGPEGPEQWIEPPAAIALEVEPVASEGALRSLLESEAAQPFQLERGPVLRARLFRLAPDDHVLSLVLHHIAADGWSLSVLWRELGYAYRAAASGDRQPLPPLPVQYADWAAWQRSWLQGGELDRQLTWWRATLEGAEPTLDLPPDRPRPARATGRGATLPYELPEALTARLDALARAEGATLQMVLLAAYAWTLIRAAGRSEVVIGTPLANRRAAEAEALIGFFVNTLPIRIDAGGREITFRTLLAQVREQSLGVYQHQDVPFERLVEELSPERALNRAPIFQTAFALQDTSLPALDLPGLEMVPYEVGSDTAKFDLMLILGRNNGGAGGDGLSGGFEYSTDLFLPATIARFAARLGSLLEWVSRWPERPLAEAPLASGDDLGALLAEYRAPGVTDRGSAGAAPDPRAHPEMLPGASNGWPASCRRQSHSSATMERGSP
ncbi:MAG: non-ribosomal peptide synthase/polyketide synthase [Candidatus Eisenbacteria bacterium]|nr:non-ribosomal peptide synthase/polyketide synthase [Candidatus Eisenbacteria bacterium]